jgi:arylsulfatase A-like enzyme
MSPRLAALACSFAVCLGAPSLAARDAAAPAGRNVIVFVADGLRAASVNPVDAPTLDRLRREGVWFADSHSLYPTFTMPNASVIATGHTPGDTGNFGNTLYTGARLYEGGILGNATGTSTPFLENDQVLADTNRHWEGRRYLSETSLLAQARLAGYSTAAIGKMGPAGLQDVGQVAIDGDRLAIPATVIIDDSTGTPGGVPLAPWVAEALATAGLPATAPTRDQSAGNNERPGTRNANFVQQWYLVNALTRAVLPSFAQAGKPFAVVFWSRDPDATQHSQGDSPQKLSPGINGFTSRAAIANADENLRRILAYLDAEPALRDNTDVFVTSDHGFATISKRDLDAAGTPTASYAAGFTYRDDSGRVEVPPGQLPPGFLAIDLAHALGLPLFDPDAAPVTDATGTHLARVDPAVARPSAGLLQRPVAGNGMIGGSGNLVGFPDAEAVVAAGGGSDLVYVPDGSRERVLRIADVLARQDYVGALFVDRKYGPVPGALPMSTVDLEGSATMPRPALVVSFRSFALDPRSPLLSAVQIADTTLSQGQGMHGALARDNTYNFMAAIGPDFRRGFVDPLPVGNADIAPTLARIAGLSLPSHGRLSGRVLEEALAGGPPPPASPRHEVVLSEPGPHGGRTALVFRTLGRHRYADAACRVGPTATPAAALEACLPEAARSLVPAP